MLIASSATDVQYRIQFSELASKNPDWTIQPDIRYRVVWSHTCTGMISISAYKLTVFVLVPCLDFRMHVSMTLGSCDDVQCFKFMGSLNTDGRNDQDAAPPHCI